MDDRFTHRGVIFIVERMGERRWRWEVTPPKSVAGLSDRHGEVIGGIDAAFSAAKTDIDLQLSFQESARAWDPDIGKPVRPDFAEHHAVIQRIKRDEERGRRRNQLDLEDNREVF